MESAPINSPLKNVQLITRFCSVEQPYWHSFLSHHCNLGLGVLHACVQSDREKEELLALPRPPSLTLFIHLQPEHYCPNQALKALDLSSILPMRPLTMLLDVDEYFTVLSANQSLDSYFNASDRLASLDVPWIMNPLLDSSQVPAHGFYGRGIKQVARSAAITEIISPHRFRLDEGDDPYRSKSNAYMYGMAIVHYCSRSFRDSLLRTLTSKILGFKAEDRSNVRDKIRCGIVPNRLKILALLECQDRYLPWAMPSSLDFDLRQEEAILRSYLSPEEECLALDDYHAYRDNLIGNPDFPFAYPHPTKTLKQLGALLP
jgi:hypothetical protein